MPPKRANAEPAWQRDAQRALALPAITRGHTVEATTKFLIGATAIAILALLVYQADALLSTAKEKMNGRPSHHESYTVRGSVRAGDVVSFTNDGHVAPAMAVTTATHASGVDVAYLNPSDPAAAARVAAALIDVNDATGAASIAGFRLVDSTSGSTGAVTNLVYFAAVPGSSGATATTTTVASLTAGGAPSQPQALAAVAVGATPAEPSAALTWHVVGAASDYHLVLAHRSSATTATWAHVDVVVHSETIASAWSAIASPTFVAPIGTAGFVVGYQCVSACCVRFVAAAASGTGASRVGAEQSLGSMGYASCPTTPPIVYDGNLLVLTRNGAGAVLDVFVVDSAAKALRVVTQVALGVTMGPDAVVVPVPVAAQQVAGLVAVASAGPNVVATVLRYDGASRSFGVAFRTRLPGPAGWTPTVASAAFRSITQDVFVTVSDESGALHAALVDVMRQGVASCYALVPSAAGMRPRAMRAAVSGDIAALAVAARAPTLASVYAMTWTGGLRPAGVARTSAGDGGQVEVTLGGVAAVRVGPLTVGHAAALNEHGHLVPANGLSPAVPTIGKATDAYRIDVTIREGHA